MTEKRLPKKAWTTPELESLDTGADAIRAGTMGMLPDGTGGETGTS